MSASLIMQEYTFSNHTPPPTVNNTSHRLRNRLSLSLPLSLSATTNKHKHISPLITLKSSASLSLSQSFAVFPFVLSLMFEITVQSKVGVFITCSAEIYYFWGIGKQNPIGDHYYYFYLFVRRVTAVEPVKKNAAYNTWSFMEQVTKMK